MKFEFAGDQFSDEIDIERQFWTLKIASFFEGVTNDKQLFRANLMCTRLLLKEQPHIYEQVLVRAGHYQAIARFREDC